tara:strand:- start:641 stop:1012 length:372 start_codon:yes stop_codon:yes gene_type:complete
MKRLLNYTIVLSLSLVVFGCESVSELNTGPTIDVSSIDFGNIQEDENKITNYKGVPFSGTLVSYHETGEIMKKIQFKDGKRGVFKEYYPNGQLRSKGQFKEDELNGVLESYYPNGQLKSKTTY